MKKAAKILHLGWAGFWNIFLLSFCLHDSNWDLSREPYLLAIPTLSALWLVFALGLFFNRRWAWYGSFALTALSLFVAFYLTYPAFSMAVEDRRSTTWQELTASLMAIVVVGLLIHTRSKFLRCPSSTTSGFRFGELNRDAEANAVRGKNVAP
jgi:hypothetical protein